MKNEDGISLIEVVVAMLLLSIVALSFAPLMLTATRLANKAALITSATAIANNYIESVRDFPYGCESIEDKPVYPAPDGRGGVFTPSVEVECPDTYPGTARVRVVVSATQEPLIDVSTKVFVRSPR